ncbi:MAG: outer membrane beta-barrel protein [Ignavibacteriaceae bacterium]
MKKNSMFLLVFCFSLFFIQQANAQLFKIGVGGGLTSFQSPASYTNDLTISNGNVDSYGFKSNYHVGVEAKFNLPLIPITPVAFIDYHVIKGSGTGDFTGYQTSLTIISIGAEAEFFILPLPFVHPYLALNVSENNFGKLETQAPNGATLDLPSKSRVGGGAGIGTEITIPPVNFDLSLKYNVFNLVGKSAREENINAVTLNLMLLF